MQHPSCKVTLTSTIAAGSGYNNSFPEGKKKLKNTSWFIIK